jgi:HEAT repeat protein
MALFGQAGTPNIERLKAKRDARGLIKALSYEADDAESASSIHRAAAHALGELRDPQAVEPLIETLEALVDNPDTTLRANAIRALGQIGDPQALEPLIRALAKKHPDLHNAAAHALGQLGEPQAIEALFDALKKWQGDISEAAFGAIQQLSRKVTDQEERASYTERIVGYLTNPQPEIRQHAAAALDKLGWKPAQDTAGASYWMARGDWDRCASMGAPAAPALIAALGDENEERQQAAFGALVKMNTLAVDALIEALPDEHPSHQSAFWAVVKIGAPAVDALIAALGHENADIREPAARALGQIGDQRALKPLFAALDDGNWAVREAACAALARFGAAAKQVLVAALRTEHDDVRWIAANALEQQGWQPDQSASGIAFCITRGHWKNLVAIGEPAVPALVAAIRHWDENVRRGAAWSLAHIGAPALAPLVEVLQDPDPYAREAAAGALGPLGQSAAVKPLAAALQDEYAEVRLAAINSLLRLRTPLEVIVGALKNEEPGVRIAAAGALARCRDERVVKPLALALQDEEASVRIAVARALGAIGSEHATQSLMVLMNDSDPDVRAAAAEANAQISQALASQQG